MAATYFSTNKCSIIGDAGLNFTLLTLINSAVFAASEVGISNAFGTEWEEVNTDSITTKIMGLAHWNETYKRP